MYRMNYNYSIGFLDLLLLLFIGLKLANVITWSWWLVFTPLLVPLGILGLVGLVALFMMMINILVEVFK